MVSRTKFARFHGPAMDRDFVEAPCMMLENFLWTPRHMKELSCHYSYISPELRQVWLKGIDKDLTLTEVPEKLTDHDIEVLIRTRRNVSAITNLQKLHYAMFDMVVHNPPSRQVLEDINFTALFNRLRTEIVGLKGGETLDEGWEWASGHTTFRAIVGSYDAGYYTYLL